MMRISIVLMSLVVALASPALGASKKPKKVKSPPPSQKVETQSSGATSEHWRDCKINPYSPQVAIDNCTSIINRGEQNEQNLAIVHLNRGAAYTNKGDYDRAIADLDRSIKFDPSRSEAYRYRGRAYAGKGDNDHAVSDYGEALRLKPDSAAAYSNRASVYYRKGDHDRAIGDATRAVELDPSDHLAFNLRGVAYDGKGDYDRAIADFSESLRLHDNDSIVHLNRGVAYGRKGQYDRALDDLTRAVELRYSWTVGRVGDDYARAIADANRDILVSPKDPDGFAKLGWAYSAKGEHDRAIAELTRAVELDTKSSANTFHRGDTWLYRGIAYMRARKLDVARADLNKARELMDNKAYANSALAVLEAEAKAKGLVAQPAPGTPAASQQALFDMLAQLSKTLGTIAVPAPSMPQTAPLPIKPSGAVSAPDPRNTNYNPAIAQRPITLTPVVPSPVSTSTNLNTGTNYNTAFERVLADRPSRIGGGGTNYNAALAEQRGAVKQPEPVVPSAGGLEESQSAPIPSPAPLAPASPSATPLDKSASPPVTPSAAPTPAAPPPVQEAKVTPLAAPSAGPAAVSPSLAPSPADPSRRVALVVGNDDYENLPDLKKAVNDAHAVGAALTKLGFDVLTVENASRRAINTKLAEFAGKVGRGDTAFFFFAGHGVQIGGTNYLMPVDTPEAREGQERLVMGEGIAADGIVQQVQERGAKVAMLVLDACRDNPFAKPGTRGVGGTRGLTMMTVPEGVFVIYSAGIGETALDRLGDNDPNPNSVFTRTFVELLGEPGLTVHSIAKRTQQGVHELASSVSHAQMPAYYDQILGELTLLPSQ
jgi:tetratricopeptide (TPR) repeat protein